jgi:4'-phosphopantetheinyl transferase
MVPVIDDPAGECAYLTRLSARSLPGIELWWVDLDLYAARLPLEGLSANEHARALSFAFGTDARRFLARRHALRSILAARTGLREALIFRTSRLGKPFLRNAAALHFSSSQSGSEAVIAVCEGHPVGVDVEIVREVVDADALTRLHFTASERAAWLEEAGDRKDRAFLTCWTRKEACVKALGLGFRLSPESFDVGCSGGLRVAELLVATGPRGVEVESLSLPSPARGVAAVARLASSTMLPARLVLPPC